MLTIPTPAPNIPRTAAGRSARIRTHLRLLRPSAKWERESERAAPTYQLGERSSRRRFRDGDAREYDRAAGPAERAQPIAGEQVAEEAGEHRLGCKRKSRPGGAGATLRPGLDEERKR